MSGKVWDREDPEFKLIEKVFEEKFPHFKAYDGCPEVYQMTEDTFQGFLAAWEFLRGHSPTDIKIGVVEDA